MTVLLREAIGDRLRHARTTQRRTLREVSRTARVSLGYLSEVERGRKEASSELLAAICEALELPLSDLLHLVSGDVRVVDEVTAPEVAAVGPLGPQGPRPTKELPTRPEPAMQGGRVVPAVVGNDLADLRLQPVLRHKLSTSLKQPGGGVVVAA
ncbi:MAG TPA: helix-turn-helix transcriptional regulator [Pseudonocardiaceae bacterium]|jgi:transcriptional regulator with XRE-family HTH domain|nr:helix-turn-helix transcriptional regulator [Pseudonocardiaceae bacterium]